MDVPKYSDLIKDKTSIIQIRKKYPDFYKHLQATYPDKKLSEQVWLYFFGEPNPCPVCGGKPNFINLNKGYRTYCSSKCMSIGTAQQRGQSFRENISANPERLAQRQAKSEKTLIQNFGSLDAARKSSRDKNKQTCLERYGTTNGGWTEQSQIKIKETCQAKWGSDSPFGATEIQNKVKQTNQQRYGFNYPLESQLIRDRYAAICLKRHGSKSPFGSKIVQDKIKQINIQKYRVKYPLESKKIREIGVRTCLEKYGVPYCFDMHAPGYSKVSQQFFDSLQEQYPNAVYATHGGEHNVGPYLLDWYDPDTNTAIEFNGDYWHANPKHYSAD